MRHAVRDGVAVGAAWVLLGLSLSACVSDDFPARPSVDASDGSSDAGAGPTLLASAPGCGSIDLVVAAGTLYWTEKMTGTVNSVPTIGGPKTVIAKGQMSPGPLAVDGMTSIYWVEAGKKRVMKKALGGNAVPIVFVEPGTATVMVGDENDINALLVAHDTLYFGRFTSALKVLTTGGTPTPIGESPDLGRPAAFAIDATHLYQTELAHLAVSRELLDGNQDGLIGDTSMTRQPLAPDRIAVSQAELRLDAIAVVNGNVIWANSTLIASKPVGAGERDPAWNLAATSMSGIITGFVVSGDTIYLGESASNKFNVVEKVPLTWPQQQSGDAGGGDAGAGDAGAGDAGAGDAGAFATLVQGPLATPVIVATDQMSAGQFAADDTNIYWRTADCKIMKLAK